MNLFGLGFVLRAFGVQGQLSAGQSGRGRLELLFLLTHANEQVNRYREDGKQPQDKQDHRRLHRLTPFRKPEPIAMSARRQVG